MLETLYKTYLNVMLSKAKGILGDHALAEDAVHEAFIRISRHTSRFDTMSADERRYLCITIVKNAALNMLRDRKRTTELPDDIPALQESIDLGIDIDAAINSLDEGHRHVVLLRLRYGFDTFQTARLLGIKYGTVLSRLSNAKKLLQNALK